MRIVHFTVLLAGLRAANVLSTKIMMDVDSGETRCLGNYVLSTQGIETKFEFREVPTGDSEKKSGKVKVKVNQPSRTRTTYEVDLKEEMKAFNIPKTGKSGTYRVCFTNTRKKMVRVELKETTIPATSGHSTKTPEYLLKAANIIDRAKEMSKSLNGQVTEGSKQEVDWVAGDKASVSTINRLAMLNVLVLVSVSGWQLLLLNKFFRSKKLI